MKVEMKEVLTLTHEEKMMINKVHSLMIDILEKVNDPDVYNAARQVYNDIEDFSDVVDTEE